MPNERTTPAAAAAAQIIFPYNSSLAGPAIALASNKFFTRLIGIIISMRSPAFYLNRLFFLDFIAEFLLNILHSQVNSIAVSSMLW